MQKRNLRQHLAGVHNIYKREVPEEHHLDRPAGAKYKAVEGKWRKRGACPVPDCPGELDTRGCYDGISGTFTPETLSTPHGRGDHTHAVYNATCSAAQHTQNTFRRRRAKWVGNRGSRERRPLTRP